MIRPFHLAIPVTDLKVSKDFYQKILGCSIGRSSKSWIDLNFFNHQLVIHKCDKNVNIKSNAVDGHNVPIPHFGIILNWMEWQEYSNKIQNKITFVIKPHIRFKGKKGERATMFFLDPDGNALEFKAFRNDSMIFEN